MGAATIDLDLRAFYERAYYVRRRRLAGKIFLVHLTRLIEIDQLSNLVWKHCDGTLDALQIIRLTASGLAPVEAGRVATLALHNLAFLLDREFVTALPARRRSHAGRSSLP
jgi:hypothetical protein